MYLAYVAGTSGVDGKGDAEAPAQKPPIYLMWRVRMSEGTIVVGNDRLELRIDLEEGINPRYLIDKKLGVTYADEDYAYTLAIRQEGALIRSRALTYGWHEVDDGGAEGTEVVLEGSLEFGVGGPTDIFVRQRFRVARSEPALEEEITIINRGDRSYDVEEIAFGFRKKVFLRRESRWADDVDDLRLVAVPHRRRFGHRVDRKLAEYRISDLLPAVWEEARVGPAGQNLPDHGSEGWVWTDGERGILVAKYHQDKIEFSIFKSEIVESSLCVRYGGVGLWRGDPEFAQVVPPHSTLTFGVSRYVFVDGGWKEGYYAFRDYLSSQGHTVQDDYDPPVVWNELYNLSWVMAGATRYTLEQLYREAEIAADVGCEALYLDPGWDTVEGSTVWDEKHMGIALPEFVREVRERFGLGVGLHMMMHTNSTEEYKGMYRRGPDGGLVRQWDGANVCTQSKWKEEKTRRLLKLAEEGVAFLMFDFLEHLPTCHDGSHGHEVPMRRQSHAEGVLEVIQNVKRRYPSVYIEAHDRITSGLQDYHPLYYQHNLPNSFDENWGFEYMWDSYLDLVSGKAISLYEYNLASNVPIYLHINVGQDTGLLPGGQPVGPDSPNMLAFWWYASTVRHLGIGGVKDPDSALYRALKGAMQEYMPLQAFFKRGQFYGIDELAHVHTLLERNQAVINLFNLTGKDAGREVRVRLAEVGLKSFESLEGADEYRSERDGFSFTINMKPLSPALVRVNV